MLDLTNLMDKFKADFPYLTLEDMLEIVKFVQFRTLKKKELFVKFGQQYGNVVYIINGLIRTFFLMKKKKKLPLNLKVKDKLQVIGQ